MRDETPVSRALEAKKDENAAPWPRLQRDEIGDALIEVKALGHVIASNRLIMGLFSAEDIAVIVRGAREWERMAKTAEGRPEELASFRARALLESFGPEPANPFTLEIVAEARRILGEEDAHHKVLATAEIQTAAALHLKRLPPPRMNVERLLPEGVVKFSAPPKNGKSWIGLSVSVAVPSGNLVFGRLPVLQGRALFLGLEDSDRRLQSRLERLGGGFPAGLDLITKIPPGIRLADLLGAWLASHSDARLIVVDTLGRALRGVDLMDYGAVTASLDPIQRLAFKHGVTVLFIHHSRKGTAEGDIFDSSLGSQGLFGAMDADLVLQRKRGENSAVLHVTGREIGDASYSLELEPATMQWMMTDRLPEETLQGPERRAILSILREAGPEGAKPSEIAALLGRAQSTVSTLLKKLKIEGLASSPKYGFWKAIDSVDSPISSKAIDSAPRIDTIDTIDGETSEDLF